MKSDVEILFISGFANDVIDQMKSKIEDAEILYKPVFPEKLLLKVRDILKRKKQPSLGSEGFN